MFDHSVRVFIAGHTGLASHRLAHMSKDVHPCGVHPSKEWPVGPYLPRHEVDCRSGRLIVDRFHPLARERTGVFDSLLANPTPMRLLGRVVAVARTSAQHVAW